MNQITVLSILYVCVCAMDQGETVTCTGLPFRSVFLHIASHTLRVEPFVQKNGDESEDTDVRGESEALKCESSESNSMKTPFPRAQPTDATVEIVQGLGMCLRSHGYSAHRVTQVLGLETCLSGCLPVWLMSNGSNRCTRMFDYYSNMHDFRNMVRVSCEGIPYMHIRGEGRARMCLRLYGCSRRVMTRPHIISSIAYDRRKV